MASPPLNSHRWSFQNHQYSSPVPIRNSTGPSAKFMSTQSRRTSSIIFSPHSSVYSSPSHSPTRSTTSTTSRSSRVRSLLQNDPLLSRLTPSTISRLAANSELGFTPGEREVGVRAAEAVIKVGHWIREVEGWNKGWKLAQQEQRKRLLKRVNAKGGPYAEGGEGFLPPLPATARNKRKRKKISISESSSGVRRKLFRSTSSNMDVSTPSASMPASPAPSSPLASPPQSNFNTYASTSTTSYNNNGTTRGTIFGLYPDAPSTSSQPAPLTLRPLVLGSSPILPMGGISDPAHTPSPVKRSFPPSKLSTTMSHASDEDDEENINDDAGSINSADAEEEEEETLDPLFTDYANEDTSGEIYWGSLPSSTVLRYEQRIEEISLAIEALEVEELKSRVLAYRPSLGYPLTDSSAIITATTLQLLPPLSKLTELLSQWAVRVAILKIVPLFLRWLGESEVALKEGFSRIREWKYEVRVDDDGHEDATAGALDEDLMATPRANGNGRLVGGRGGGADLTEEEYQLITSSLDKKVVTAGRIMDLMLDSLEGQEDVLPEFWIERVEAAEAGFATWAVDGERKVLESNLRRENEEERKARLVRRETLVLEKVKLEEQAREGAERVMEVVREAEGRVGGLRDAMGVAERAAEEIDEGIDESEAGSEPDHDFSQNGPFRQETLLEKIERVAGVSLTPEGDISDNGNDSDEHPSDLEDPATTSTTNDVLAPPSRGRLTHSRPSTARKPPLVLEEDSAEATSRREALLKAEEEEESERRRFFIEQKARQQQRLFEIEAEKLRKIEAEKEAEVARQIQAKEEEEKLEREMVQEEIRIVEEARQRVIMEEKEARRLELIAGERIRQRVAALEEAEKKRREEELEQQKKLKAALEFERALKAKRDAEERARKDKEEEERCRLEELELDRQRIETANLEAATARAAVELDAKNAREAAQRATEVAEAQQRAVAEEAERRRLAIEAEAEMARAAAEAKVKAEEEAREGERARLEQEQREEEKRRKAEEEDARILTEKKAEAERELERVRLEEENRLREEEAQREQERLEAEAAAAKKKAEEEAEAKRLRIAEEERIAKEKAEAEAETERLRILAAEEVKRARLAAEAEVEAKRVAEAKAVAKRQRIAAEEAEATRLRILAAEEAERARLEAEAEARRVADAEAEAERQRIAAEEAEAERLRVVVAEEAKRARLEAEAEAERLRILEEQAAAEAERVRLEEEAEAARKKAAEEAEVERLRLVEIARIAAENAEAERIRLEEEEARRVAIVQAERLRVAEEERLAAEKVEAEAERLRLEEAERKAAEEEVERLRLQEEAKRAAEEAEAERLRLEAEAAAEIERLRKIEEERLAAEKAEIERLRLEAEAAAEAERLRLEEAKRAAEEAETERLRLEAKAAAEAERLRLEETKRAAEEAEAERLRLEAEAAAAAEAEAVRLRKIEEERLAAEKAEIERLRLEAEAAAEAAEAERLRLQEAKRAAEEAEAERLRLEAAAAAAAAAEAERLRIAEEEIRRAAEEAERLRIQAEIEAANKAAEEAAEAERLRLAEEARIAAETERWRLEAESRRKAIELKLAEEAEAKRLAKKAVEEAERQRLAEQACLEAQVVLEKQKVAEAASAAAAERLRLEHLREEEERQRAAELARIARDEEIKREQEAERKRVAAEEEAARKLAAETARLAEEKSETERLEKKQKEEKVRLNEKREAERHRLEAEALAELEAERQKVAIWDAEQEVALRRRELEQEEERKRLEEIRQAEDRARIARIAKLAREEDSRVQRMERESHGVAAGVPSSPKVDRTKFTSKNGIEAQSPAGSPSKSSRALPQTPRSAKSKPPFWDQVDSPASVVVTNLDEGDDTQIIHSMEGSFISADDSFAQEDSVVVHPPKDDFTNQPSSPQNSAFDQSFLQDQSFNESSSRDHQPSLSRTNITSRMEVDAEASHSSIIVTDTDNNSVYLDDNEGFDSDSEFEFNPVATSSPKLAPASRRMSLLNSLPELDSIRESPTPRNSSKEEYFSGDADVSNNTVESVDDADNTFGSLSTVKMLPDDTDDFEVEEEVHQERPRSPRRISRIPSYAGNTNAFRKNRSPSRSISPIRTKIPQPPSRIVSTSSPVEVSELTKLEPTTENTFEGRRELLRRKSSIQAMIEAGEKYMPSTTEVKSLRSLTSSGPVRKSSIPTLRKSNSSDGGLSARSSNQSLPERIPSPEKRTLRSVSGLKLNKQHQQRPAGDFSMTPDKRRRKYEETPYIEDSANLTLPDSPLPLESPTKTLDEHLDEKINNILTSLPSKVRLTASNLRQLQAENPPKRNLSFMKNLDSPTGSYIPGPKSTISNTSSIVSGIPAFPNSTSTRRYSGNVASSDIKLYHLHRSEGQAPIKLFVRLVGVGGERVMVRVGGGWADLAEYLKEYANHHGSQRRAVSTGNFEIQDLPTLTPAQKTIQTRTSSSSMSLSTTSIQSTSIQRSVTPIQRSVTPSLSSKGSFNRSITPSGSRPTSPMPPVTATSTGGGLSASRYAPQNQSGRQSPALGSRGGRSESPMFGQRGSTNSPASGSLNPVAIRGGHSGASTRGRGGPPPLTRNNRSGSLGEAYRSGPTPRTPTTPSAPSALRNQQEVNSPSGNTSDSSRPGSAHSHSQFPRPPSSHRPGSSSSAGGLGASPHHFGFLNNRPTSRLSFTENMGPDTATHTHNRPVTPNTNTPLGLAGPKGKKVDISPENQAWVNGMLVQLRKVSAEQTGRTLPPVLVDGGEGDSSFNTSSNNAPSLLPPPQLLPTIKGPQIQNRFVSSGGGSALPSHTPTGPSRPGTSGFGVGSRPGTAAGGSGSRPGTSSGGGLPSTLGELGKVGGTRRVYVKKSNFSPGTGGGSYGGGNS